jgi:intraflagellar transport protein 81
MAAQLKEIVDRLNSNPFNLGLSLVDFDGQEPFELMQTLNKVLGYLDKKHNVDPSDENPEAMYQRISECLHVLGYRSSYDMDFQQGVMSGDKGTIHPILYWLLQNLAQLQKRAYLANFCVNIEVPEDFLRDEQLFEMFQHYKELQSQFKTTHSHVETQRQGRVQPGELQREVAQLDAEKQQLEQKIQQFKQKSANEDGFQVLLKVTSMLRKEQEEEARLAEKVHEQRMQLEQTEQMYMDRSRRLHEVREAQQQDVDGGAETMLRILRSEVRRNRDALSRVQREGEEKVQRLQQLETVLSEPQIDQADINDMENELAQLQEHIGGLEATIAEQNQPDSRLTVYKQQASLVAKKKEMALKDKKVLEDERDTLGKQLSQKEREYEQMRGHKFMKRDEFKNYAASLRDKSAKFKRLKGDLSNLRHECAVLTRTEQILQAKDPTPSGMRQTEAALEKASVEKSKVDQVKGKTLDEISSVVTQINAQLKDKKNKLAPMIKSLRTVRQNFQAVEATYLEKKSLYDSAQLTVNADLSKYSGEVVVLQKEVEEAERQYHEIHVHLTMSESRLNRAVHELKCQRGEETHSKEFSSLSAEYSAELSRMEQVSRDLRKQQKAVKESHEDSLAQRQSFIQLESLMRVKLKVSQQEMMNLVGGDYTGDIYGSRPVIDVSQGGVNRMIIGD